MKWIPTSIDAMLETLSPQDLEKTGAQDLAINMLSLLARPGLETLETVKNLNHWINAPQTIIPTNGLSWFCLHSITTRAKHSELRFKSPLDGNEIAITPQSFITLQINWKLDYAVTLSCPLYALKKIDAVSVLSDWITKSLAIAKKTNQKILIELPCLPAAQIVSMLNTFSEELLIHGVIFFLEDKADNFAIDQQILSAIHSHIPPHWIIAVNTNLDLANLMKIKCDWLITQTPFNDAKAGVFYAQAKKHDVTEGIYATAMEPLAPSCVCDTCAQFTKAYLHHLMQAREVYAWRLLGIHNWNIQNRAARVSER